MNRYHPWPPEHVALLGTMTDSALAKRIGVTTRSVQKFRARRRILARSSTARVRSDETVLRGLLTETPQLSTRQVADAMGWTKHTALRRLEACPGLVRERVGRRWVWSARRAA